MLSDKQLWAIDLIVAGLTLTEIEEQIGVSHAQLWRWRQEPEFRAVLEQRRAYEHELFRDRWRAVGDQALGVVSESLSEGDPKMAIDIVRLFGAELVNGRGVIDVPTGATDSRESLGSKQAPASKFVCTSCTKACRTPAALASHARTHVA